MTLIKNIVFLSALFACHIVFAGEACNMNGDWYSMIGSYTLIHFTQAGELLEGRIDDTGPCNMSFGGTVIGKEIVFRNYFSGIYCPDPQFYSEIKAGFSEDCTSISGISYMPFNPSIQSSVTLHRMPVRIIEPKENEFIITAEPKMPDLTFKAKLVSRWELAGQSISPFTWEMHFRSTSFPEFHIKSYEVETNEGLFNPDFNRLIDLGDSESSRRPVAGNVMGGELTVSIAFYKNLHDEKKYTFKGTNPGQIEIEKMISDKTLRQIACTESRYRQFDARREKGIGFPLIGLGKDGTKGGAGMMQLYKPKPTPEQIWNWRENIKGGMELYRDKYRQAVALPNNELDRVNEKRLNAGLPLCKMLPALNAEQLERETLRRYNCGTEYQWKPWNAPDCKGQWVIDPSCRIRHPNAYDAEYVNKVLACDINK